MASASSSVVSNTAAKYPTSEDPVIFNEKGQILVNTTAIGFIRESDRTWLEANNFASKHKFVYHKQEGCILWENGATTTTEGYRKQLADSAPKTVMLDLASSPIKAYVVYV